VRFEDGGDGGDCTGEGRCLTGPVEAMRQHSLSAYGIARVTGKDGARVRAGRAASSVGNANPVVFKGPFTAPVVPSCTVEPHPTCHGRRQSTYVPARPAAPPPHLPTCHWSPPDHPLACAVAEPPHRQSRPHGPFSVSIPRVRALQVQKGETFEGLTIDMWKFISFRRRASDFSA